MNVRLAFGIERNRQKEHQECAKAQRNPQSEGGAPVPDGPAPRKALEGLREYLGHHVSHLHYAQRLAEGRSIGSGQVEGACKNLIGRRLKQTGARWRVRRVNRMASLCCLIYSHAWKPYWNTPAA
jgi:hypothetical protein